MAKAAAATKDRPAKRRGADARSARADAVMDLPVQFGDVSIGDGTARLGVRIDRNHINVATADANLCGRRLDCRVVVTPGDDDPDQTYFDDMDDKHELRGAFDVKKFTATPKAIAASLTMSLEEINSNELAHFAKRQGRLIVANVVDAPELKRGRKKKNNSEESSD